MRKTVSGRYRPAERVSLIELRCCLATVARPCGRASQRRARRGAPAVPRSGAAVNYLRPDSATHRSNDDTNDAVRQAR